MGEAGLRVQSGPLVWSSGEKPGLAMWLGWSPTEAGELEALGCGQAHPRRERGGKCCGMRTPKGGRKAGWGERLGVGVSRSQALGDL